MFKHSSTGCAYSLLFQFSHFSFLQETSYYSLSKLSVATKVKECRRFGAFKGAMVLVLILFNTCDKSYDIGKK